MAKRKKKINDDDIKSILQAIKTKSQRCRMIDAVGIVYEIHILSTKALEILKDLNDTSAKDIWDDWRHTVDAKHDCNLSREAFAAGLKLGKGGVLDA